MSVYTPLFQKIVFSSLWEEEDFVVKVFLTMLAKQDSDHVVRCNAYELGKWSHKNEAVALEALAILSAPDTKRIEAQPFDGRRVEKVEDGWLILNGATYQKMMQEVNRRAYQRRWMADKRARLKLDADAALEEPERIGETMAKQPEFKKAPRKAKEPDKTSHASPVPTIICGPDDPGGMAMGSLVDVPTERVQPLPATSVPEPKPPEPAQNQPAPGPARVLDSTKAWSELVAGKKVVEAPVGEPERPVRRTVLDPGQPARPVVKRGEHGAP